MSRIEPNSTGPVKRRKDQFEEVGKVILVRKLREQRASCQDLSHALAQAKKAVQAESALRRKVEEELLCVRAELAHQAALAAKAREESELYQWNLAQKNAKLEALATVDGQTGLKNHSAFNEKLDSEFERAVRFKTPLSVIMLDVDRFKLYNDMYGHLAGDDVLKQLAQLLRQNAREVDFVARYGGEEFAIIMPADQCSAVAAAERLRLIIEEAAWPQRAITASFGVATLAKDSGIRSPRDLVADADHALYYSKSRCRNRVSHAHDVAIFESETGECIAINTGGDEVENTSFTSDRYYHGGKVYEYYDIPLATDGAARPAPELVYKTERFGDFVYRIPGLTPGACFLTRLHFTEYYFNDPGKRVFNVAINGITVLENFDIVAECGGAYRIIIKEFPAVADANGEIVISYLGVIQNAKSSGIELVPFRHTNAMHINCGGGPCVPFVHDEYFHGGAAYGPGFGSPEAGMDLSAVTGIVPLDVYQRERGGDFAYIIPNLPIGVGCLIRLHFSEQFVEHVGHRVFNVAINDIPVLDDFDILAEAYARFKGIVKTFAAVAGADGKVKIEFKGIVLHAQVNGVEVYWR